MKDQVVTQKLQEKYLYFYICFIANTQILLKLKYLNSNTRTQSSMLLFESIIF